MRRFAAKGSNRSSCCAAVSGVAVLLTAWSAPGLAAPLSTAEGVAEDLTSLQSLRTEFVDLSDVSASPEDSDDLNDAVAPLLYLTPRVASILEDVFGDSEDSASAMASEELKEPAASPVVDHDSARDMLDTASPMYEHAAILPRFQRQMYRTDI